MMEGKVKSQRLNQCLLHLFSSFHTSVPETSGIFHPELFMCSNMYSHIYSHNFSTLKKKNIYLFGCLGSQLQHMEFLLHRVAAFIVARRLQRAQASVVVVCGFSCPMACEIFPDQRLNLCPLYCKAYSQPLDHHRSPCLLLLICCFIYLLVMSPLSGIMCCEFFILICGLPFLSFNDDF